MVSAGWRVRGARRRVGALVVAAAAALAVGGMPAASAAVDPLQALVDAAADGATIDVPAGIYDGPIDLHGKALHLRGPATDPLGTGPSVTILADGVPGLVVSGGTTVENLEVSMIGGAASALVTEPGHAGDVTVRSTSFTGSSVMPGPPPTAPRIDVVDGGPGIVLDRVQILGFDEPGALRSAEPTTVVNSAILGFSGSGAAVTLIGAADEPQVLINNLVEYVGVGIDGSGAQNLLVRNTLVAEAAVGVVFSPSAVVDHNAVAATVEFVGGTPGPGNIVDLPSGVPIDLLSAGSPVVDAGSADGAPDIDFRGTARPLDGDDDGVAAVDIGPLESEALGGFHPVQPFRLFDSRNGSAPRMRPASAFQFTVAGKGAVPATGVRAVVLNLTGVFPTAATHLSVWPGADVGFPDVDDGELMDLSGAPTSNVNVPAGAVVPNLVMVDLSSAGRFLVANNAGFVDVVADVVGWYDAGPPTAPTMASDVVGAPPAVDGDDIDRLVAGHPRAAGARATFERWAHARSSAAAAPSDFAPVPEGGALHPVAPVRTLDTRSGLGAPQARVGAGGTVDLQVTGVGGVPSNDVTAVVLNVTGVLPTAATHVTVWPAGTAKPLASSLNLVPGQAAANLVTVKVGPTGAVSLGNHAGQVDLVADVVGWFDAGGGVGGHFSGMSPARLYDSRDGAPFVPGTPLAPGETRVLDVSGLEASYGQGAPEIAHTVVLNVTGIATAPTHLTVWPSGPVPATSSLNLGAGETRANLVVVEVGPERTITIRNNSGSTHVVVDLFGWFTAPK